MLSKNAVHGLLGFPGCHAKGSNAVIYGSIDYSPMDVVLRLGEDRRVPRRPGFSCSVDAFPCCGGSEVPGLALAESLPENGRDVVLELK